MTDVARLARVSHQTVSRVINNPAAVRPETRHRVEEAIASLGYRPNAAARTLVTSRSRTIGVVAAGTTLFGPASILLAVEQAARGEGWIVNVASLPDLRPASVSEAFTYLEELRVGGIVVIAPQRNATDAMLALPSGTPVVAVDGGLVAELPIVCVDQSAGARQVTEHLLGLGHRTVHHIAGPQDWLEAEERVSGWLAALVAAGAPVPEPARGDWTAEQGFVVGARMLTDPAVTAVFAANDQTALGVIRAVQQAGRQVPDDVSIAGFDDLPEAPYYGPALTSVRQGFPALGELAVRTLVALIEGQDVPLGRVDSRTVAPELVVRASTGPPRH